MSRNGHAALLLVCLHGLLSPACQRTPGEPPAGVAGAAAPVSPAAASPESERDRQRREAFAAAIAGLDFDTASGLIEVTPLETGEDPEAARLHLAAGERLMARNRYTPAIARYTLAIRSGPGRPDPYVALGIALLHHKKSALAVVSFRTAVERDPGSVDARFRLGGALWTTDRRQEAVETLEALVAGSPGHGPAHERLAIWHYYAGDYSAAWKHVHGGRRAGHDLPPHFVALLEAKMPDPGGS